MTGRPRISVCIGDPGEQFVPRWTFWTHRSDVYLTTKSLGGFFKLSLHASGVWVGAFTSESGATLEDGNRRASRWSRPNEFQAGFVKGPEIVVPRADKRHDLPITERFSRKTPASAAWVPAPQLRHAVHLCTFFDTGSGETLEVDRGRRILGELPLANGEAFAVIAGEEAMSREWRRHTLNLRDVETEEGFGVAGPYGAGLTAASVLHVGTSEDGLPLLTDVPLGTHNFHRIDGPQRARP